MRPFTLEELAGLSAEQAVASRFDQANFRAARWFLLVLSLLAAVMAIVSAFDDPQRLPVLLLHLAFNLAFLLSLRRQRLGLRPEQGADRALEPVRAWLVAHPRAAIVTMLVVQLLLVLMATLGDGALAPLLVITSFFVLAFRLGPAERLLVHGFVVVGVLLVAFAGLPLAEPGDAGSGPLPVVLGNQIFPLVTGLALSRRRRRDILASFGAAQESAKDQLRMRQELDYAREIQLAMLPAGCPPQSWLDVCSHSCPATEVGGDYYDYFPLEGDRLAVVVGDVAGHGMASGLLLAGVRSCLTLLVEELEQPLVVLTKLNRMVQQTARRRTLVTLAIVVLDPRRRSATVANAGHPPGLLLRAGAVEEIALPSLPLGTQLEPSFRQREIPLEPDDVLLLHSDGLYESADERGEAFGLERLAASLQRLPRAAGAAEIRDTLLADLAAFTGGALQRDDLTFVAIRVGPEDVHSLDSR